MLLAVLVAAAGAPTPPTPKASPRAQASGRIERPAMVNRKHWEKLSARSEIIVRDEQGRPNLLRLIEHR
jgi:hypothetical protein